MFGFRPDGRRISTIDPIVRMTPYLMPMRCDAQVFLQQKLDYEPMARYIAAQSAKGEKLTFMHIVAAAYVRAVSQHPEVNRFIMNKQYYSRKNCTVSFTMLKDTADHSIEETAVKVKFDPTDTIYDVRDRMTAIVQANRGEDKKNFADVLARGVLAVPVLPNLVVGLVRLLDRYGLCPGALLDALPFHTGLFITNMASIGMHSVYHHIYNFGSTSMFLSMGSLERGVVLDGDGNARMKRQMPIGITADERVCAGAVYAGFFATMLEALKNPALLEVPPVQVRYDPKAEYHVEKVNQPEEETGAEPVTV